MAAVFEPGTSCTDVVCGTLAQHFNQYRGLLNILPIPRVEWLEELETITGQERERERERERVREGGREERERERERERYEATGILHIERIACICFTIGYSMCVCVL